MLAVYQIAVSTPQNSGPDSDGDGLSDQFELSLGLDPNDNDSNDDGVFDNIFCGYPLNNVGATAINYYH